jgi:sarcosine oxidase
MIPVVQSPYFNLIAGLKEKSSGPHAAANIRMKDDDSMSRRPRVPFGRLILHNSSFSNREECPMTTMYDVAVVGNGMIGAAASRYLSAAGLSTLAIGPAEPDEWQTHDGVFASHYDQGRVTRIIDPDDLWALLGSRSIAAYADLEAASGIQFHHAVGCLRVSPFYQQPDDTLAQAAANGDRHGADYTVRDEAGIGELFPFLRFAPGATALWERGGAGYINPRALVQAQLTVARQQTANIVRETVARLEKSNGVVTLFTDEGNVYTTQKVLVAAGAYTNHILGEPILDLEPRAVSIVKAQVRPVEVDRLSAMPSIIYRLADNPTLYSIYCLPPVEYPDGFWYVKIGGTLLEKVHRYSREELVEWFHGPGNSQETEALREVLVAMIPELDAERFETRPCVVTYTAHDHPYIDVVDSDSPDTGQIFVAAGGCGSSAKSSNEIGRIAAMLVQYGVWAYDIEHTHFQARYIQPA